MLGDATAGKTSLTIRYISGFFLDDLKLTSGVDFYSKITNYKGVKVKLQIRDFGVDERSRFLLHQHSQGANAALFLYNITIPNSLDLLLEWTQTIREQAGDIPIMLVGTIDHLEKQRAVTREKGIQAAKKHNLSAFIEVSSKTGQNVEKAFDIIIEMMIKRQGPNANMAKHLLEPLVIVTLPEVIHIPKPLVESFVNPVPEGILNDDKRFQFLENIESQNEEEQRNILEMVFPVFLDVFGNLANIYKKDFFRRFVIVGKKHNLIFPNRFILFNAVNQFQDTHSKSDVFFILARVAKENGWLKNEFPAFLDLIETDRLFVKFISWLRQDLKEKFYLEIEEKFLALLKRVELYSFSTTLFEIDMPSLSRNNIDIILDTIHTKLEGRPRYNAFSLILYNNPDLINTHYLVIEKYFLFLLNDFDNIPVRHKKDQCFLRLMCVSTAGGLREKFWEQIKRLFLTLLRSVRINKLEYRYSNLLTLINTAKDTQLFTDCITQIKEVFLLFLKDLEHLEKFDTRNYGGDSNSQRKFLRQDRYVFFTQLIEAAKRSELITECFKQLSEEFAKLPMFYGISSKQEVYRDFINAIKGTVLENKFFEEWKLKNQEFIKYWHKL